MADVEQKEKGDCINHGLICNRINYNKENNNVTIDFNTKNSLKDSSTSMPKPKGMGMGKSESGKETKRKYTFHSKGANSNSKPSQTILRDDGINGNPIESRSVKFNYNHPHRQSNSPSIKENSIVKTDQGYEIYFVENSVSNKNKTNTNNKEEDLTVQEEINTQELISQNYGLKEALKNNEDTYNSLEKEFMFNTNNNNNSNRNSCNSIKINGDNNNQLLLNFSDNDNDEKHHFFSNISESNNILNENSIMKLNNPKESRTANNNHIIINFNNYNYQFSAIDADNSNIKRYNSNNLSLEDLSLYSRQNSKLIKKKIFRNNPVCNLSNRLVNDENNILNKSHLSTKVNNVFDYKFIDDVKENAYTKRMNKIKAMIPMTQFLLLERNAMLIIIHFVYDDIEEIKSSFESIKNKVNATLSNYYYPIVEKFNKTYSADLELHEYYFRTNKKLSSESLPLVSSNIFNRKYQPKTRFVSLDLYIKGKIISTHINQTYSISLLFNYLSAKTAKAPSTLTKDEQMILTWKYVLVNGNNINIWIASEAEDYDGRISRFSYIQPIVSYAAGDFISIKLPILFKDNAFDQGSISWVPIERTAYFPEKSNCLFIEKSVYHNTHASLMKQYDKIRFCELETLIHLWKSEKSLTNRKIVNEVKKLLLIGDVFNELSFEFDIRRVYIFKAKLKAIKAGIIKRNKYFNFDIIVKEANCAISNETQCLGLLHCINSQYEMRIGESLLFYFSEIGG